MQKRIFRFVSITITAAILLFGIIGVSIGFQEYTNAAESELRAVGEIATKDNHSPEEINNYIDEALDYDVRITYVESDGTVSYDNTADVSELENHGDRTEVVEAMKNGSGQDSRLSETLGETTYYYAVKYQDGVIRFSRERSSFLSLFINLVPLLVCLGGAVILVTTIVSMKLSESIVEPIKKLVSKMNLIGSEIPPIESEYEELEPIIKNVNNLSKRLSRYIERLKREKEKVTLIIDNMVEGMILLDSEDKILSVNNSAVELLNPRFEYDEPVDIRVMTSNRQLLEVLAQIKEQPTANNIIECGGKSLRAYVSKAHFGDGYGVIILLVDVTESIKAEVIRRDFSANVSHELKTPLTTIKGFGEMLENGIITDKSDVEKYGGIIFRESERLLLLINDIIRLSEIEEKSPDTVAECKLLDTANDVVDILQHKADSRNITIHVDGTPVTVEGNQNYINELILNLADNSIKYNNDGGNVWISIGEDEGKAVIAVRDDGIGISDEDQERIFERFYRVDKSRSKQIGGTGLGLSIVKHIVSYHGGEISIKSQLGKGTVISIILPEHI